MAYSIDIYDSKGKSTKKIQLNEDVFVDAPSNEGLIHEHYLLQTSNARINIACVKGRWAVHGSGRKLYKQKSTGNARTGDKNSPVRRGGGVAFGPRGEANFIKKMPQKMRRKAVIGVLLDKVKEEKVSGIQDVEMKSYSSKEAVKIIENLGGKGKKILFVLAQKRDILEKSLKNIPQVKYVLSGYLNTYDILHADKVIIEESAFETINK